MVKLLIEFLQHKKPQLILGLIIGLYFILSFLRLL